MVVHLATALDVPLRSRNALLGSAGFAPVYAERGFDTPDMAAIDGVLMRLIEAHPFPAYIVDTRWNIVRSNTAAGALTAAIAPPDLDITAIGGNAMRLMLHPAGVREAVANFETVAVLLMARLRREAADRPDDDGLARLVDECALHVHGVGVNLPVPEAEDLLVPLVLRTPAGLVRLFTTIATVGAAYDVTLEELRIETLLPADAESDVALRRLLARESGQPSS